MKITDSRAPTDTSRRRLLKQVGCGITAVGISGIAGCTETTASDESQQRVETRSAENNSESVDEPSSASQSNLAGTTFPDGPPEWIETNMAFQGWYDARAYNLIGWDFNEYHFYLVNRGLFNLHITERSGTPDTQPYGTNIKYAAFGWGELHIEAAGSNAFLTVSMPEGNGFEVWITGTLQIEKYWVGFF